MGPFYDSPAFGGGSIEKEEVNGVSHLKATRTPCPVCGHLTGDCVGDSPPPKAIWGYNTNTSYDANQTYLVEEDYYEEREIGPNLFVKILVYKKGKYIPLSKAKELGFII